MREPTSPKYRGEKPARLAIQTPQQVTADPTSRSPKDGRGEDGGAIEEMSEVKWMTERPVPMLPRCLCCYCDGVDDVSNEGTTRSCGHAFCSSSLHQLEIGADKSSRQAQVVQSSVHQPSHRLDLLNEVFMALAVIYSPLLMPGQIKCSTMAPTLDMV
jgi:hypothetical protein